jgi:hypothetical protein
MPVNIFCRNWVYPLCESFLSAAIRSWFGDRLVRILSPLRVGIKTPINSAPFSYGILLMSRRSRRTLVALAHEISPTLKSIQQCEKQEEVVRNLPITLVKPEEHRRAPSPLSSFNRRLLPPPIVYAGWHCLKELIMSPWCRRRRPRRKLRPRAPVTAYSVEPPPWAGKTTGLSTARPLWAARFIHPIANDRD